MNYETLTKINMRAFDLRFCLNVFLGSVILVLLLVDCTNRDVEEAEIALSEMACQPEDVGADPPFIAFRTSTAVPNDTFLADKIENYYSVNLIENALTYTSAFCDLFEMVDEESASEILNHICTEMEAAEPPPVGEEACGRQSTGFRLVNFRQGRVVVSILADSGGFWVDEWAEGVNGRIQ